MSPRGGSAEVILRFRPTLTPFGTTILPLSGGLDRRTNRICSGLSGGFGVSCSSTNSVNGHCHERSRVKAPFYVACSFSSTRSNYMAIHSHSAVRRIEVPVARLRSFVTGGVRFWRARFSQHATPPTSIHLVWGNKGTYSFVGLSENLVGRRTETLVGSGIVGLFVASFIISVTVVTVNKLSFSVASASSGSVFGKDSCSFSSGNGSGSGGCFGSFSNDNGSTDSFRGFNATTGSTPRGALVSTPRETTSDALDILSCPLAVTQVLLLPLLISLD